MFIWYVSGFVVCSLCHVGENKDLGIYSTNTSVIVVHTFGTWLTPSQTGVCYSKRLSLSGINNMRIYIDNLWNTNYKTL